jgi:hypothetical protein
MSADGDRDGGDVQPRDERDDRPALDFESAFADLALRFRTQSTPGVGPWPAAEDVDPGEAATGVDSDRSGDRSGDQGDRRDGDHRSDDAVRGRNSGVRAVSADEEPADDPGAGTAPPPRRHTVLPVDAVYGLDEPEPPREEGYVPPEPPPIPRGDLISRLAWAGVIGGPVFLLLAALVWRDLPAAPLIAALVAFVGGFVTLVARMPGEAPPDDDDGAVV